MKTTHMGERLYGSRLERFAQEVIAPEEVSPRIVDAFSQVDRAAFAPSEAWHLAYTNEIIDLTPTSTISQPTFVANMLEHLNMEGPEKVLEIGTATGYQAALLSHLASEVYTVEIDEMLADKARENLQNNGYGRITVAQGDGALGLIESSPFDRIIVAAGLREIPQTLIDQLAVGGKIVAPVGPDPEEYKLVVLSKITETEVEQAEVDYCRFVPLFSAEQGGWTEESLEQAKAEKMERQRKPARDWLIKVWQQRGLEYVPTMKIVRGLYSEALGLDEDLSEEQVLDICILSWDLGRPSSGSNSTDSHEQPAEKSQAAAEEASTELRLF
jgi:protein-L-isoaspartate(D-aspartate) O-methyltransferase